MATGTGVLELIVRAIAGAFEPLGARLASPDGVRRLAVELGHDLSAEVPQAQDAAAEVARLAGGLSAQIAELDRALAEAPELVVVAGAELLVTVRSTLAAIDGLGGAMDAVLDAGGGRRFAAALFDFVLVDYLATRAPVLTSVLEVLGLLERVPVEGTESSLPYTRRSLHLTGLPALFKAPADYLRELYGWGDASFTGVELLGRLRNLLEDGLGRAAVLILAEGAPAILEAYLFSLRAEDEADLAESGQSLPGLVADLRFPSAAAGVEPYRVEYPLRPGWSAAVTAEADFEADLRFTVRPPLSVAAKPPGGDQPVTATVRVGAALTGQQAVLFRAGSLARLEAQQVVLGFELAGSWTSTGGVGPVTPTVELRLDGVRLVTTPRDGFVSSVARGNPVDAGFDLTLLWSPETGLSVQGGAGLTVRLPVRFSAIPFVDVDAAWFALDVGEQGLVMRAALDFEVSLGPLRARVVGSGMTGTLALPSGNGQVADAGPAVDLVAPGSIGLGLESGPLRGGGHLDYDPERKEYAGTLQVGLGNLLFTAIGLLSTERPDGQPGYSLILLITGKFRGVRLGYGFTLDGIGGLVAVNRTADVPALQQGHQNGALDSLMFPERPLEQAPQILSDLRTYFPESHGSYLVGPMVRLGWGPVPVMRAELGLVLEVPDPVRLLLFGRMDVGLPTLSKPFTGIHLDVLGVADFDAGTLALDARLVDSRIGIYLLEGEAAIRARWKSDPDFALSIGGFHPRANPPAGFPALRRLALNLSSGNPTVRLTGYFALTPNSVQFGAQVEAYASVGRFSVEGFLSFDTLFRFDPFRFVAELTAGAAVRRSGRTLLAVALKVTLSGPQPWHVAGTASFRIVWKFTVRFSFTRGSAPGAIEAAPVDLRALLVEELGKASAWSGQLPVGRGSAVVLRDVSPEPGEVLVLPQGRLTVRQTVAPLGVKIEKYGERRLTGGAQFQLTNAKLGGVTAHHNAVRDNFAPAQYFDLTDDQRLRRPAFESYRSGAELDLDYAKVGDQRVVRPEYEEVVLDLAPEAETDEAETGGGELTAVGTKPRPARTLVGPSSGLNPVPLTPGELARSSRRGVATAASGFRQRVASGPIPTPKLTRNR